jgi:hypothetical protein
MSPTEDLRNHPGSIEADAWVLNAPDDPEGNTAFLSEKLIRLNFRVR